MEGNQYDPLIVLYLEACSWTAMMRLLMMHISSLHRCGWCKNAVCVFDFVHRAHLHLDLQWIPVFRHPGHTTLCVPEDRQPLHCKSGALRRGQLHLCSHQHGHQKQCARTSNPPGAAGRWYGLQPLLKYAVITKQRRNNVWLCVSPMKFCATSKLQM